AEAGNRRAPTPVPVGLDAVEMHDQRVARLCPFNVEWAGLRIDLGEIELGGDGFVGNGEGIVRRVTRAGDHRVTGPDARGWRMSIAVGEIDLVAGIVFHLG